MNNENNYSAAELIAMLEQDKAIIRDAINTDKNQSYPHRLRLLGRIEKIDAIIERLREHESIITGEKT